MNNQVESPFANPRFIISIVVVFLFLWGWQFYISKKYPQANLPAAATATAGAPATTNMENADKAVEKSATSTTAAKPAANAENASNNQTEEFFNYEDENVSWKLSSYGMGLDSLTLKKYFGKDKKPVVYSGTETSNIFSAYVKDQLAQFKINKISETEYVGLAEINGQQIKRTLIFNKEKLSFESRFEFEQTPKNLKIVTVEPKHKTQSSSFLFPSFEKQDFLYKGVEKAKTEHISGLRDEDKLDVTVNSSILSSVGSQYFTQSYIDKSELTPSINMSVLNSEAKLSIIYNLENTRINTLNSIIYIGPKQTELLEKIDPILPEVLDYGIFGFISKPLLNLMKFMFGIFGNWGVAIIALTLVVRLLVLPFNIMSFKSAKAMQKIQPQLQAVREKYKSDPMQMNRETMALMKEHNANPLSSCLPMLLQIPIFFALWQTIGASIEIYQQPFFGWITDLSSHDTFFVLPVLMGLTMFFQQKLTPTTMDPMQQKILNFMPIIFSVFMLSLPSGLTLYNFISALFGVIQQYFLLREKKA